MSPPAPKPSVLTIAEAAADLLVRPAAIWRWHDEGKLEILFTAADAGRPRRGPKGARIRRDEWERFKHTLAVSRDPTAPAETKKARGRKTAATATFPASSRWLGDDKRPG